MRPTLILGLAAVAGLTPVRADAATESTKGKCFAPAPAAPSDNNMGTAEPPRIPLWLGFDTGTTEDEVRAYDPTMLDRSSARKYPLIPGLEMTAQVTVDPKTHRAISVSLTRTNKFAATKQALIAMFGQPTWKDFSSREVNGDFSGGGRSAGGLGNTNPGGYAMSIDERFTWCVGSRKIVLREESNYGYYVAVDFAIADDEK